NTGTRLGEPEEHEDRRRLPGAVLAEEAEDLAGADVQLEVVHRDEVAIALAQPAGDDRAGILRDLDPLTLADPALLRDTPIRAHGRRRCRAGGHRLASPVAPGDPVQAGDRGPAPPT